MKDTSQNSKSFSCPIPIHDYPQVLLAHGGGGRLMHHLIGKMFLPALSNPLLDQQHDGAVFSLGGQHLAFTTDSFVVRPLFFPGGNIGNLAIHGTVNDLAMCGARPMYLSAGLILEEGFPMETLWQVVQSMQEAAEACGVQLVTGDTKVVDKGKGDGIFINTSGIGIVDNHLAISPDSVQPGDVILINGDVGRHGIAVMNVREGLSFETEIESDLADLSVLVLKMLDAGVEIHCMRDMTRGGLASAVIEIAESGDLNMQLEEAAIPVRPDVRGACEVLGLDPLYVANEGRFVAFVPPASADLALEIMRSEKVGQGAVRIGEVGTETEGLVSLRSAIGVNRIIDMLSGEQLPRIC
jgi:hydrogenase expression/formation protein HypE